MPHRVANEGGVVALRVQQAGTGGCRAACAAVDQCVCVGGGMHFTMLAAKFNCFPQFRTGVNFRPPRRPPSGCSQDMVPTLRFSVGGREFALRVDFPRRGPGATSGCK
eukprot:gene10423-biopygen8034